MLVRFIAHAGIHLEENGLSMLIDPWFRGSSVQNPLIESLDPKATAAIDFQVPPTKEAIQNYHPNVILLSHFHAHHAPLRDIIELVENSKEVLIAYPKSEKDEISERFVKYSHVTLRPCTHGEEFTMKGVSFKALLHTVPDHMAWFVEGKDGSVLHIADARANKDKEKRTLDPLWQDFAALNADAVFLSIGGNSLKSQDAQGEKKISTALTLSPGEAANLIRLLNPKIAVPIGCYNKSLWSTMREYMPPSYIIEDEFYWALSWTAPEVRPLFLKPGNTVDLKKPRFFSSRADYSIG